MDEARRSPGRTRRRLPRWRELKPLLRPRPFIADPTRRRLARAESIPALREIARRRTPKAVFDYTEGGSGAEHSISAARRYYDGIEFLPHVLRDVSAVDTRAKVLGQSFALPVGLAPTGFTRLMHHEGEIAAARAAEHHDIPYALSTMGTTAIEDVEQVAPTTQKWFQLYLWRDRQASIDLIRRARHAGFDVLTLTVDTPVAGARLRDVRNGLTIPPALTGKTLFDAARHPRWWLNLLTTAPLEFASLQSWNGTVAELANTIFDPAATVEDVKWLREQWDGKLVVKGIQRADDAVAAVEAGADALVVSNHGGRQLDQSIAPLKVLPEIKDAVDGRCELLVDGGVLSGRDVVAALSLGADFVLLGRAYLYGLMAGGEQGVHRMLDLLSAEIKNTMQLLGATAVQDLHPGLVRVPE